jgi:hypothetical protein
VTVGTPFERSKVPLCKWLMAAYLLSSSRKGISAQLLHGTLGVTYKTAWRMARRIPWGHAPTESSPCADGAVVAMDSIRRTETAEPGNSNAVPNVGGSYMMVELPSSPSKTSTKYRFLAVVLRSVRHAATGRNRLKAVIGRMRILAWKRSLARFHLHRFGFNEHESLGR